MTLDGGVMQRKTATYLTILTIALIAAATAAAAFYIGPFRNWPSEANMRRLASTAQPLIAALHTYHTSYGCYPENLPPLFPGHLDDPPESLREWRSWTYSRHVDEQANEGDAHTDSYSLYFKLGWDPCLRYSSDEPGQWEYDQGDGGSDRSFEFTCGR